MGRSKDYFFSTKYTLLNQQGEPLSGFCMYIDANHGTPETAVYVNATGAEEHVRFVYNKETRVFDVTSSTKQFTMAPVLVGQDIVGLNLYVDNSVAHYALDFSDNEEPHVYDTLSPPMYFEEFELVGF